MHFSDQHFKGIQKNFQTPVSKCIQHKISIFGVILSATRFLPYRVALKELGKIGIASQGIPIIFHYNFEKKILVAELKFVAENPRYAFLKMRKKYIFRTFQRGLWGKGCNQGLKIYMKTELFKYYNILKFWTIPRHASTKFAEN